MLKNNRQWFIDTVVLCNFSFSNSLSLLFSHYGNQLKITTEVYLEIVSGLSKGYITLKSILDLIDEQKFERIDLTERL